MDSANSYSSYQTMTIIPYSKGSIYLIIKELGYIMEVNTLSSLQSNATKRY